MLARGGGNPLGNAVAAKSWIRLGEIPVASRTTRVVGSEEGGTGLRKTGAMNRV